jgi:hypothetical protein
MKTISVVLHVEVEIDRVASWDGPAIGSEVGLLIEKAIENNTEGLHGLCVRFEKVTE